MGAPATTVSSAVSGLFDKAAASPTGDSAGESVVTTLGGVLAQPASTIDITKT